MNPRTGRYLTFAGLCLIALAVYAAGAMVAEAIRESTRLAESVYQRLFKK